MTKKIQSLKKNYEEKYGFHDKLDYKSKFPKGINEDIIREISRIKNEPRWMLEIRLKAYKEFVSRSMPQWGADLSEIDFDDIRYFAKASENIGHSWDEVPESIKETFDKLKIPQSERKFLAGTATQYESEVVYSRLKKQWANLGVIFEDTDTGLKKYPELFKKYFGTIVPYKDNKFAALNTAVWSGGSFIYIPKGVKVKVPLQTYFRINLKNMGQFERTLIIADEGSEIQYLEGCFTRGAQVLTTKGEKNIEEVNKGDKVITHKGREQLVYKTMSRNYKGNIYKMKLWGDSSRQLNVTEEHPLLVCKREKKEYRNKSHKIEWLEAKDCKVGDYLVMPIRKSQKAIDSIPVATHFKGKNLLINLPIEPDFYRLLGYFFAEGHIQNQNYISFSFNSNEEDLIRDTHKLIEKHIGKTPTYNKQRQNGQTIFVSSTKFARVFNQEFGSTVYNKNIPEWIFRLPDNCLKELIKGMWLGDGSYDKNKNYFRYSSISKDLAHKYRDILLRLNILCSINYHKRVLPRKGIYTVNVSSQANEKFGEIVGIKSKNGKKEGSPFMIDEDYIYLPIKSIEKKHQETRVYNFSVEEDESYVAEGVISHNCTAPMYTTDSLHAAVVEIIVEKNAKVRYTTIQNWSDNVYNLVTKRAIAKENARMEWVDCNLGSKITMKYPAVYLLGKKSHGEVLSIAYADGKQVQDTGAKIIHRAPETSSLITSKSICLNGGRTSYRGLLKITKNAKHSKSKVICDALIFDNTSRTDTYPTNEIDQKNVKIEHEASVSKVSQAQLFYLTSRGLSEEEATSLIVSGFLNPISKELPMEYATELNALIKMSMEGSVG